MLQTQYMYTEPRNQFPGLNSTSLCSLAGRYDNPIPTRFLAPIECLKIPALFNYVQTKLAEGERGPEMA
jgi:hypothetical protein